MLNDVMCPIYVCMFFEIVKNNVCAMIVKNNAENNVHSMPQTWSRDGAIISM